MAGRAGLVHFQPLDPGIEHVVLGAGARALGVPADVLEFQAGADAGRAPAMARVVGKETRVEFREAASAGRARALGGKRLRFLGEYLDRAFADLQCRGKCSSQFVFFSWVY